MYDSVGSREILIGIGGPSEIGLGHNQRRNDSQNPGTNAIIAKLITTDIISFQTRSPNILEFSAIRSLFKINSRLRMEARQNRLQISLNLQGGAGWKINCVGRT